MNTVESHPTMNLHQMPVIVVEDEETVLSFLESSLRSRGFASVHSCDDRASALRQLEQVPEGPVALIIDVALRADNGLELATQLLNERPEARVLLISGFIDEMVLPGGPVAEKRVAFLAKPFNFRQFVTEFDRLLAG